MIKGFFLEGNRPYVLGMILLGRDIIGKFGLFMHENTRRIYLLKDNEIPDALFSY